MSEEQPKPDWQLAQALYVSGRGGKHADIAKAAHVTLTALRKRIARQNWGGLKERLNTTVAPGASMEERSAAIKTLVAADLHESATKLQNLKRSDDAATTKVRLDCVTGIVSCSEKVFGWNEQRQTNNTFNFALLDSAWHVDLAAGVKSRGHETRQLTPAEIAEWAALDAQKALPQSATPIDVEEIEGE